ncbi:MAG: beta-L-arabinofuranosidase domain-containing protein [Armatimonadota bacterium]
MVERIKPQAQPFKLQEVRLGESPFQHAMQMNARYLLMLEPDRLLHRFRLYAGLQPKAPVYGGWESMGVSGHTLGHYLSACSMQYAATGDDAFRKRVDYIVEELALCQQKHGNGYVSAIPEGERIFREVSEGNIRAQGFDLNGGWVPWYTMHKLFAGLIDAFIHCGNEQALFVVKALGDWAYRTTERLSEPQWQTMLACEHGGMNEAMANLYALTNDEKYLQLARKFYHKAVLDRLANGEDCLPGLHANTQIPKVIGVARLHELTGEKRYRDIATFFWEHVVKHHSYVIGGHSDHEHFGPPDKLANRLSTNTCETCNTYNMLKLTRHLFAWEPKADYMHFYERALYNHILASQDPQTGMVCYYVSLKPGHFKTYSTPSDSFWCCVGTGIENHTKYGDTIFFHSDSALYLNLFIPCELQWKQKGMTARMETGVPQNSTASLHLTLQQPTDCVIRVRQPRWCTEPIRVRVNGRTQRATVERDGYIALRRHWQKGDKIDIALPTRQYTEPMPDDPNLIAVLYGPLVLAGILGKESDPEPRIPVLVNHGRPPQYWLRMIKQTPLTFRTRGAGRPNDTELLPFHWVHHQRYTVYWRVVTEAEWQKIDTEYREEQRRLQELEQRTIDAVRIGEEPSEREHNLQGDKTSAGEFNGKRWRHAVDGGWFSYDLHVLPGQPVQLLCTYWGSDSGGRGFDILVDGKKIATQTLDNNQPGRFFDVSYPLPQDLTAGKERVTVRFQAHPGRLAGGVFGLRILRPEERQ